MEVRSSGFFYGWFVVFGAFLVLATAYGLQFSYGVFLPEIARELGWDRSALAAPYSIFVLVYTTLSLITGRLTDRFGPSTVIAIGALALASGYALLSTTTQIWQPYIYLGAVAALGSSVAFVPCNATVIRWFVRRRGFALGLASCGVSAAAMFGPPLAGILIITLGWRDAMLSMAIAGGIAMALAAQVMVRDPEARGLAPDGDPLVATAELRRGESTPSWTLRQAQHTGAFWLLVGSLFFTWLVVFLPFVHLGAHGVGQGLSPLEAASLLSGIGVGGLVGRVVSGGLTDRFGRLPGLFVALFLQAVAFLGFGASHGFGWLMGWALVFGFGYSGVSLLFPALIGDLFGREHIGNIAGFVFGVGGWAAAAGPYVGGVLFDATGDYIIAFLVSSAVNSFALLLLAFLKPLPRRDSG